MKHGTEAWSMILSWANDFLDGNSMNHIIPKVVKWLSATNYYCQKGFVVLLTCSILLMIDYHYYQVITGKDLLLYLMWMIFINAHSGSAGSVCFSANSIQEVNILFTSKSSWFCSDIITCDSLIQFQNIYSCWIKMKSIS